MLRCTDLDSADSSIVHRIESFGSFRLYVAPDLLSTPTGPIGSKNFAWQRARGVCQLASIHMHQAYIYMQAQQQCTVRGSFSGAPDLHPSHRLALHAAAPGSLRTAGIATGGGGVGVWGVLMAQYQWCPRSSIKQMCM